MPPKMSDTLCSREGCDNQLSSQNKSGVCAPCQQGRKPFMLSRAAVRKPKRTRRADDELLERAGLAETKADEAPPAAVAAKDETWLAKFYRLHEALGLNAEEAIEEFCQDWVEKVTERALGPELVKVPRTRPRRERSKPNGHSEPPPAEASAHE